jgi:hypothetical protein
MKLVPAQLIPQAGAAAAGEALSDRYRPGERRWLKRKNSANPRVQQERDAATRIVARSAA